MEQDSPLALIFTQFIVFRFKGRYILGRQPSSIRDTCRDNCMTRVRENLGSFDCQYQSRVIIQVYVNSHLHYPDVPNVKCISYLTIYFNTLSVINYCQIRKQFFTYLSNQYKNQKPPIKFNKGELDAQHFACSGIVKRTIGYES